MTYFPAVFCLGLGLVIFLRISDHCQGKPAIFLSPKDLDHIFCIFFCIFHIFRIPPPRTKAAFSNISFSALFPYFSTDICSPESSPIIDASATPEQRMMPSAEITFEFLCAGMICVLQRFEGTQNFWDRADS
jgi:hypothetical protein